MTPDEAAFAAFEALGRRDWERVVACAGDVKAPERPALEARAACWRAQALRELGRLDEAERAAAAGVALAKRAGDAGGVATVRAIHASILQALAARRAVDQERARDAELVELDEEVACAGLDANARAAWLVRKAGALADLRRKADALATAEAARLLATEPRERVLALLTAARVLDDPGPAIHAAHAVADASDDMNLVTAVARAARAAGISLAPPRFG